MPRPSGDGKVEVDSISAVSLLGILLTNFVRYCPRVSKLRLTQKYV